MILLVFFFSSAPHKPSAKHLRLSRSPSTVLLTIDLSTVLLYSVFNLCLAITVEAFHVTVSVHVFSHHAFIMTNKPVFSSSLQVFLLILWRDVKKSGEKSDCRYSVHVGFVFSIKNICY